MELIKEMPNFLNYNVDLIKHFGFKKINYDAKSFTLTSPAYLTTTENINAYFDKMDFQGKDVLTVIGASDHVFNAILRGARKVDAFDISLYAIMFYYLKEAAIKALNYSEFIMFIFDNRTYFNKKLYAKVKPYLNKVALQFWNMVFNYKKPTELIFGYFTLINAFNLPVEKVISNVSKVSSYVTPANYAKLKEQLNACEIRVFLADAKKLDYLTGPYDYMIFSNIIDCEQKTEFLKAISRYVSNLNIMGEIKVGYLYTEPSFWSTLKKGHKYEVEPIPSFSEAITGEEYPPHYIVTKKRIS